MSEIVAPATLLDALRADPEGAARDSAIKQIEGKRADIKKAIDSGVAPDEFQTLSKVEKALEESSAIVEIMWKHLNKTSIRLS